MTPTLPGRWQTRILLFIIIGLPVTFLVAEYLSNWRWPPPVDLSVFRDPFVFITTLLVVGLVLDPLYILLQRFHWDNDWPFAYQFFSIVEFFITYGIMYWGGLDYLLPDGRIPFEIAAWHFTFVFVPSFIALLGLVQIFLVRWRFKGGELGRM